MNKQALRESVYHYCNNSLSHIKCTFFFCKANIYKEKPVFLRINPEKLKHLIMKHLFQRGLLLVATFFGLAFHLAAQSTLMTIHMNDGTERNYYMSEDDRVYFEGNDILVVEIAVNAKAERYNLADIRKITCSETEGVSEEADASVFLSPNPVHDKVMLHNLSGIQPVGIYALDGRIVKSVEVTADQFIDISDLPVGLYLVKTERQTLKMIKL